jgi:hypothetical protein
LPPGHLKPEELQGYLAGELQDSCRKNIVREHELEHVSGMGVAFPDRRQNTGRLVARGFF